MTTPLEEMVRQSEGLSWWLLLIPFGVFVGLEAWERLELWWQQRKDHRP